MISGLCTPHVFIFAEEHKELEYNNSVNTSAQAHLYLHTHPDFLDAYGHNTVYNKVMSNERTEFEGDTTGASSFRHRGDDTVLVNSVKGKSPSYPYSEGDYVVASQAQNRISNDAGEQQEMLTANLQGYLYNTLLHMQQVIYNESTSSHFTVSLGLLMTCRFVHLKESCTYS
jgi:hypothetical protein